MEAKVIQDATVLIPNKEHKNFTVSGSVIPAGSIIHGKIKQIQGLRRGTPFTYKLFVTDENKIIFLNKIKMETTEVTLGADAQTSPTKVNLKFAEKFNQAKLTGTIIGGLAGLGYAKYKKHQDARKVAMFIGIGAIAGYFTAQMIERHKKVAVQPSK